MGGSVFGVALLAVVVTVLIVGAGRNGGHSRRLQFDDIFDPAFKPETVCHTTPLHGCVRLCHLHAPPSFCVCVCVRVTTNR